MGWAGVWPRGRGRRRFVRGGGLVMTGRRLSQLYILLLLEREGDEVLQG